MKTSIAEIAAFPLRLLGFLFSKIKLLPSPFTTDEKDKTSEFPQVVMSEVLTVTAYMAINILYVSLWWSTDIQLITAEVLGSKPAASAVMFFVFFTPATFAVFVVAADFFNLFKSLVPAHVTWRGRLAGIITFFSISLFLVVIAFLLFLQSNDFLAQASPRISRALRDFLGLLPV